MRRSTILCAVLATAGAATFLYSSADAQSADMTCYKVRPSAGSAAFGGAAGVALEDRLGASSARVKKPRNLCLPTAIDGENPGAPQDPEHLEDYRAAREQPFTKVLNETLEDRFGTLVVDLRKPDSLMVPTAKDLSSPPAAPSDPTVPHHQCYRAKRSKGQARFARRNSLALEDQFGSTLVDVKKPKRVCLPVSKDGQDPDAVVRTDSLVCYKVRQADRPKFQKRVGVHTANDFGNEQLDVIKQRELCVATQPGCGSQLCVSNDCGASSPVATIPDAENSLFTDTGRLFVSGGSNVFEITADGSGGFDATPISSSDCNFTGLAQLGNTIYANCFDGNLYAAQLTATPSMTAIHALGLTGANGMTAADGKLYLVNGPTAGDPKIVRIALDPVDPLSVIEQIVWFVGTLQFPNGIEFDGTDFYLTDSNLVGDPGSVRKLTINPDGSPGTLTTVWSATGILDDIDVTDDFILVAGFQNGDVTLLDKATATVVQSTLPATFASASSVRLGRPPLFSPVEVLVTEKGVLGDLTGPVGNLLSVFAPICPGP